MTNLNLLPPDIRAAANNAWRRAQEGQKAQSLNTSQGFGSAALLNTLNAGVREARKKGKAGFSKLEIITDPETQRAFGTAFALSERLVGHIGLSAPTPEQMVSVGVNLQYLAKQFELMEQEEGVAPHVVLAPHGLGKENWLAIARKMTSDTQTKIGQFLGDRDHSTIVNSEDVITKRISNDNELNQTVETIKKKISPQ